MNKDELNQRRAALEKERDTLITDANNRIIFLNGQIQLLAELTADDEPPELPSANGVAVGERYEPAAA